jgi:predicted deacylase
MEDDLIRIDGNEIAPGKNAHLRVNVSELPTGTSIHINVHVFRSKNPGPKILLLGGLHGDEVNGVDIVKRVITSKVLRSLHAGSVIAIPLLNVYGFINFSRSLRDGKDVNRSFPGTRTGSLASQVANMMTREVLPNIDFGVDFHTGGSSISNHPQLRVSKGDVKALELAHTFSPPIILLNKPIPKSHRLQALKMGKPMLVFEGGESLRLDEQAIQMGIEGVHRLLNEHQMLSMPMRPSKSLVFEKSKWVRASKAGLVRNFAHAGEQVTKGQLLAEIYNLDKLQTTSVRAPLDGVLAAHVSTPVAGSGDALFHIVY